MHENICLKICHKIVNNKIENYIKVCLELKNHISNVPNFIKSIITGHRAWAFGYDPNTRPFIVMKV